MKTTCPRCEYRYERVYTHAEATNIYLGSDWTFPILAVVAGVSKSTVVRYFAIPDNTPAHRKVRAALESWIGGEIENE